MEEKEWEEIQKDHRMKLWSDIYPLSSKQRPLVGQEETTYPHVIVSRDLWWGEKKQLILMW